ncbi:MAG: DUF1801 domain-containing protein [Prolixibacteraceae bacterium]|nr:DUF1801 domain-containing protein [Prolixibacteraceae bacterium]
MQSNAQTVDEYISQVPDLQREAITQLREVILSNLPEGFSEEMNYGMMGYVVPHSLYPKGYHCDPKLPLPFLAVAAQKNFIAVYHMGIYADARLLDWFTSEYPKHSKLKLDMGKSCIRFKNPAQIPFGLIGELAGKMQVADWINCYESNFIKK